MRALQSSDELRNLSSSVTSCTCHTVTVLNSVRLLAECRADSAGLPTRCSKGGILAVPDDL